jgi:hypothetical protein
LLKSFKALIDALLAFAESLAQSALEAFTAPIYIPVISEILADFGISEFSALDVISWLAAVPVTVGYKAVKSEAPFPDNELTTFLSKDAQDFEAVVKRFSATSRPMLAAAGVGDSTPSELTGKPEDEFNKPFSIAFHSGSGLLSLISMATGIAEIYYIKNPVGDVISIPNGVRIVNGGVSLIDSVLRFTVNRIVPHAPLKDQSQANLSVTANWLTLLHKMVFAAGPVVNYKDNFKYFIKAGAFTDFFLILGQVVMTGIHLAEVRTHSSYGHDENAAIVDEVSGICTYSARICRDLLALEVGKLFDPETEAVIDAGLAGGFAAARFLQSGLQFSEAGLEGGH